jgi:2-dehydropantoate 2-reductase
MSSHQAIYILGLGNIAKLFAHSLRKTHPDTPIKLIFHRDTLISEWRAADQTIEIVRDGKANRQQGFDWERLPQPNGEMIRNLIVATKTYGTVDALKPLKKRLNRDSTILFLQNGMGTVDEVTQKVFTQSDLRPRYLSGIVNHGVYKNGPFSSVHAGFASTIIGPALVKENEPQTDLGFLANQIQSCPDLVTTLVSASELSRVQLQKLTVNAVVNPLTVIFDCINAALFERPAFAPLLRALIEEISGILQAVTSTSGLLPAEFSADNLEEIVVRVGTINAKNISSMRQDVMAGRKTEVDYINGYLVNKAREHGLASPINAKIVELVKRLEKVDEANIKDVFGL